MGFWCWLLGRRQAAPEATSPTECAYCSDAGSARLQDYDLEGPKDCYLGRCPACGQYWGGHGYTPHFRWALSPQEAAEFFPGLIHEEGITLGLHRLIK